MRDEMPIPSMVSIYKTIISLEGHHIVFTKVIIHYVLIAFMIVVFTGFAPNCHASLVNRTYTFAQLGWDKSVTLNG